MDTVTRRRFLLASGVTGAAALAAGAGAYTLRDILATAGDRPADAGTLVLVTLYGGNDGLNTVIPYADPAYHDARPDLAYGADEVLRVDGGLGLNPALAGLHGLYGAGRLAIVRGAGYPKPNRSHFQSMDIWQTGRPDRPGTTGWLGRWLDTNGADPRLAVSFEPALPVLLAGERGAGAAVPVTRQLAKEALADPVLAALGEPQAGETALRARAAACFADLLAVDALVAGARQAAAGDDDADPGDGADGATATGGATSPLQAQLDLVAQCVEAGAATRVFSVSLGGFDTHADEKQAQSVLLGQVDKALAGFAGRMARTDAGRKVVVAVYSEFGRRVHANASDGTDHGTASDVFLLGAGVHGGLYGAPPSLTDLDDGDLRFTTDFRDVYATLLEGVLGTDPEQVLGPWRGRLEGALGKG
jgi:uncharacterized protein (DUF1501 family)